MIFYISFLNTGLLIQNVKNRRLSVYGKSTQAENGILLSYMHRSYVVSTFQNRLGRLIYNVLISIRHNHFPTDETLPVYSLLYRCFRLTCSDELQSLVLTITAKTRRSTDIVADHPHSLCIQLMRCKLRFSHFFP